jgi:hypothetical protein
MEEPLRGPVPFWLRNKSNEHYRTTNRRLQSGDKPKLKPLEPSERKRRFRDITRRVAPGERIAAVAEEFEVQPSIIVR